MALVTCPDCSREISSAAASCPQCGRPMQGQRPVHIEQSLKEFRIAQVAGLALLLGVAPICCAIGALAVGSIGFAIGAFVGFVGLVVFLSATAGAWWNRK